MDAVGVRRNRRPVRYYQRGVGMGTAERWTQMQQRVCVQVQALVKPGGTRGGGGGGAKKESNMSGKQRPSVNVSNSVRNGDGVDANKWLLLASAKERSECSCALLRGSSVLLTRLKALEALGLGTTRKRVCGHKVWSADSYRRVHGRWPMLVRRKLVYELVCVNGHAI